MEEVIWKLDESNDVAFKVDISSSEPVSGNPKVRLVCESKGIDYAFHGKFNGSGEVEVVVPPMEGKLSEGEYSAKLEVILEDKIFIPLEFDANFQVSTKVVAEMVQKKEETIMEEPRPVKASLVSKPRATRVVKEAKKPTKKATVPKKQVRTTRLKSLKEKFGQ